MSNVAFNNKKKRIVFHVPFKLGYAISGGGIRPGKMILAFKSLGYDVDVVSGSKEQRKASIEEIKNRLTRGEKYAFCYAESSVLPTMLTEKGNKPFYPFVDFDFFAILKQNGVKCGLFYRDIYWKFVYYMQDKPLYTRLWRKLFYHLDLHYYSKLMDTFFLPSMKLAYLLPKSLQNIASDLPAAHDMVTDVVRPIPKKVEELRFIYVGGVSCPVYDISPLIKIGEKYRVTICTREDEWQDWQGFYGPLPERVSVRHLHGETLKQAFLEHNISAIVRNDHPYLSFAMPNKMYEAVGQNIPLLVSGRNGVSDFVASNNIGWVLNNDFNNFDPHVILGEYAEKVLKMKAIKSKHHWKVRASKVESMLT